MHFSLSCDRAGHCSSFPAQRPADPGSARRGQRTELCRATVVFSSSSLCSNSSLKDQLAKSKFVEQLPSILRKEQKPLWWFRGAMKQTPRPDVAYIRVSARGTLRPPQPARLSIRCRPRESLELITPNNRLRVISP
jgi:hypothetical protein